MSKLHRAFGAEVVARRDWLLGGAALSGALALGCEGAPRPAPKAQPKELVLATEPLGLHWGTSDPFLFCAYHKDAFPRGNEAQGPRAELSGRNLGNDFTLRDGWRMYHGRRVPGFPQHPHRGFETVSIARQGYVDHADSLGATARYGQGDVQWMTAGGGIVHAEMFPLVDTTAGNPLEMFQVWLNLPAADKLCEPHFKMLWAPQLPRFAALDADGRSTVVTVVAGRLGPAVAPAPPPRSWAARPGSDVAIWTLKLDPSARFTLPSAQAGTNRTLYFFSGASLAIAGRKIGSLTSAKLVPDAEAELVAGPDGAEALLLQGKPIGEPVARRGPFVMNTDKELRQAYSDYQRTRFGGWPWAADDPVHKPGDGRFARHVDGRLDRPG